jgi:SAM-dependent methyltransferase
MPASDATSLDHRAAILRAALAGELPPRIAFMRLCMESRDPSDLNLVLDAATAETPTEAGRLAALKALHTAHPNAWTIVKSVLQAVSHDTSGGTPQARVAAIAAMFDGAVNASPEASVALYSLGDPEALEAATAEVVDLLLRLGLGVPEVHLLEIGCGIGRFLSALSPHVGSITGLDISPAMVTQARRRCSALPNVAVDLATGLDLQAYPDARFSAVLGIDSFPYLVDAGGDLVLTHVRDAHRVLAERGTLTILNFSYRGDPARDRADVDALASACGFTVVQGGTKPLALWDGTLFHLQKR